MATGLRAAWDAWKRLARRIGDIQARILLTVFYYLVLGPFALVLLRRSDPLALGRGSGGWRARAESPEEPMVQARRQS